MTPSTELGAMDDKGWLAARFEEERAHLTTVAYRMVGSLAEADDVVQEAWMRLNRSDTSGVENLRAWLTTVVARISLDLLRSRKAKREEPLGPHVPEPVLGADGRAHPEHEALLADSVGLALLVVLEKLNPAERLAFVLHDLFDLPFDEIAPLVGRSPAAARQLASRARRRVRGTASGAAPDRSAQRKVVDAFLAASRSGDFDALVAVLDPDVVLRLRGRRLDQGAPAVARQALRHDGTRFAHPALVDGMPALIVVPRGKLVTALVFAISGDRITEIDVVNDSATLDGLDVVLMD
jgi:RNA polymerase sigma factor (sigma-70 family)